jgi:hypothetical protein
LVRGGHFLNAKNAGVFAVNASNDPSSPGSSVGFLGFRCAR